MPTSIIVIVSVVAAIAFLLIMRVKVCVCYSGGFDFAVKYLFITFRIKKQEKGQAKQEKKQPQKFSLEQLRNFLDIFERFRDDAEKAFQKVKKGIRIDIIKINLTIGGEDAAMVAITYGEASAIIYPAVSALENSVKVRQKQISINANFNGTSNVDFYFRTSMRLGNLLALGVTSTVKILVSLIKNPIKLGQRGVVK